MAHDAQQPGLSVDAIQRHIERAGTSIGGFGGTWIGGYQSQQEPPELAATIHYLLSLGRPFRNYLEIGAAAGGTARLLDDFFRFERLHIIDLNNDGMLDQDGVPLWTHRKTNLPKNNVVEWVGDSQSVECDRTLEGWGVDFDLVLIDGDHSYEGVKADTHTVIPNLADNAIVIFHDVVAPQTEGVHRWAAELKAGIIPGLTHLRTFGDRLGLGVFAWQP